MLVNAKVSRKKLFLSLFITYYSILVSCPYESTANTLSFQDVMNGNLQEAINNLTPEQRDALFNEGAKLAGIVDRMTPQQRKQIAKQLMHVLGTVIIQDSMKLDSPYNPSDNSN